MVLTACGAIAFLRTPKQHGMVFSPSSSVVAYAHIKAAFAIYQKKY